MNDKQFSTFDLNKSLLIFGKKISFLKYIINHKREFNKRKIIIKNKKNIPIYPSYYGLKIIQTDTVDELSRNFIFPDYVHGGVKGKSQKTNALVHKNKKHIISTDIRKFFPSIKKDMVLKSLIDNGMHTQTAELLTELFTYRGSLQIGPPSSPFLANLAFLPVDALIYSFCRKHGTTYSRYFDDISISSNKEIYPYFGTIKKYLNKHGFEIAPEKTFFMGKNVPQLVTKIVVNNKPRPRSKYISEVKKNIRRRISENQSDDKDFKKSVRGKINYIKQYDKKIGREVRALLVRSR